MPEFQGILDSTREQMCWDYKKISCLFATVALFSFVKAQLVIDYATFHLDNGLKVLLLEDHSQPVISGAVYVHVGSKNDPADATGLAHYFEHIMFKGTDSIGTVNWPAEKTYLDSLTLLYDQLHATTDKRGRTALLHKINEITIASAQFAIPNETDAILSKMGAWGVNAFTDFDATVYYNNFPANQLQKWLKLYAERFRTPVFRLFQTELEAVFEEKNGYDDSPYAPFLEDIQKVAFGNHPYSRPILGYTEHLKNPQLSKLYEFFDTYYVANNMTLILVGDFEIEQTKILVQNSFSILRRGTLPQVPFPDLPVWKGHLVVNSHKTPIGVGVIGYRGVPANHPDATKIDLLSSLFSNNSHTGLLDELATDHKLFMSFVYPYSMRDHGVIAFGYIPKIIIQSHRAAGKYVMAAIDSVKTGNFSDLLFDAIKMDYLKQHTKSLETISEKAYSLLQCELAGRSWQEYLNDLQMIEQMTKAELVTIAQKYLTENYLDYRSHIGFPKKKKMDKPDWKPIPQQNGNQHSVFAQNIEQITVKEINPQKIDFQQDITIVTDFLPFPDIYAVKNPANDIFKLDIRFDYGDLDDPKCAVVADYFNLQGTDSLNHHDFSLQLQALGATISMQTSNTFTNVHIEGFDKYFDAIMDLCLTKLIHPGNDKKQLKTIKLSLFADVFMNKNNASTWGQAAIQYAAFQNKSYFLRDLKYRDVGHLKGVDLWNLLATIRAHQATLFFSGNIDETQLRVAWDRNFPELVEYTPTKRSEPILPMKKYDTTTIFIASKPKFIQSNIYFYSVSDSLYKEKDKATIELFNQYFGKDMSSLVFQEIRELRALAYSASGNYRYDDLHRVPAYLLCFIGTQTDKTVEAIEAMRHLIDSMPLVAEKFNTAQQALKERNEAQYIHFRNIPFTVKNWIKAGYQEDPRLMRLQLMKALSIEEMNDFYQQHIQSKPLVIALSGNKKRFQIKSLSQMGKVVMLKKRTIF